MRSPAFASQPDMVLLDEPCRAIDELTARRLRQLRADALALRVAPPRPTRLLVTHNVMEAALLADCIVVLGRRGVAPAHVAAVVEIDCPRSRYPDDLRCSRCSAR